MGQVILSGIQNDPELFGVSVMADPLHPFRIYGHRLFIIVGALHIKEVEYDAGRVFHRHGFVLADLTIRLNGDINSFPADGEVDGYQTDGWDFSGFISQYGSRKDKEIAKDNQDNWKQTSER